MKRPRHNKSRPKFFNAQEPVAAELPDLLCDLTPELREQLPSELLPERNLQSFGKEES